MKYLLLIVLALGAVSCQTASEELIKENEALRAQAIEARQMAEEQAVNAKEAQAQAHAAAQVKLCKRGT